MQRRNQLIVFFGGDCASRRLFNNDEITPPYYYNKANREPTSLETQRKRGNNPKSREPSRNDDERWCNSSKEIKRS